MATELSPKYCIVQKIEVAARYPPLSVTLWIADFYASTALPYLNVLFRTLIFIDSLLYLQNPLFSSSQYLEILSFWLFWACFSEPF